MLWQEIMLWWPWLQGRRGAVCFLREAAHSRCSFGCPHFSIGNGVSVLASASICLSRHRHRGGVADVGISSKGVYLWEGSDAARCCASCDDR